MTANSCQLCWVRIPSLSKRGGELKAGEGVTEGNVAVLR